MQHRLLRTLAAATLLAAAVVPSVQAAGRPKPPPPPPFNFNEGYTVCAIVGSNAEITADWYGTADPSRITISINSGAVTSVSVSQLDKSNDWKKITVALSGSSPWTARIAATNKSGNEIDSTTKTCS